MLNTTLEQQIKSLREQGASYSEIKKQLNCSKATISYHLGDGQKQKVRDRTKELRKNNPLLQKKERFIAASGQVKKPVHDKIRDFQTKDSKGRQVTRLTPDSFNWEDLLSKFTGKCYLTGRDIDLHKTSEYHLDHIVPRSKGGPGTLENCNFACKAANVAKGDLSLEEFQQLCVEVVKHFKLKID
jgi:5-methylcytosine-specific restriction endonuclease McrA